MSKNFVRGKTPVFFLADGQIEMICPNPDHRAFEEFFPGVPYVLAFVRGHSKILLSKLLHKDGTADFKEAIKLLSSAQQVEDIEAIRKDMTIKNLLPPGGKISLFGPSGGGVLAQQYLAKYGGNVSKVMLEVTGAPDLSRRRGISFIRDLRDYDPSVALEFELLMRKAFRSREELSYMLFNLGRMNMNGSKDLKNLLKDLNAGKTLQYSNNLLKPVFNLGSLVRRLSFPEKIGVKVRLYELFGEELRRYIKANRRPFNLVYEWTSFCLNDFLAAERTGQIERVTFLFNRSSFAGEALIIAGTEDVVFSPKVSELLFKEYKHCKVALLKDGHGLEKNEKLLSGLRSSFLRSGLDSVVFNRVLQDSRFHVMEKGKKPSIIN